MWINFCDDLIKNSRFTLPKLSQQCIARHPVGTPFLNKGVIAVLGDSYWSWGLILCVLSREKFLRGSICFKLTNKCWKTYSENYGES